MRRIEIVDLLFLDFGRIGGNEFVDKAKCVGLLRLSSQTICFAKVSREKSTRKYILSFALILIYFVSTFTILHRYFMAR